jgi:type II pantothenate kinase
MACCILIRPVLPVQVVLVANSLPAINDITVYELKGVRIFALLIDPLKFLTMPSKSGQAVVRSYHVLALQVVAKAAEVCPTIRAARDAAVAAEAANGGRVPPVPGLRCNIVHCCCINMLRCSHNTAVSASLSAFRCV